jgi:protein-tyrosine-phosphatase
MKSELRKAGNTNARVSSAGIAAAEGGAASDNAKRAARQLGVSLGGFRSRPLTVRRVRSADLILTMSRAQKQEIIRRWPDARDKTHVITQFSQSGRRGIDDPIGRSEAVYVNAARALADETKRVLRRIRPALKTREK